MENQKAIPPSPQCTRPERPRFSPLPAMPSAGLGPTGLLVVGHSPTIAGPLPFHPGTAVSITEALSRAHCVDLRLSAHLHIGLLQRQSLPPMPLAAQLPPVPPSSLPSLSPELRAPLLSMRVQEPASTIYYMHHVACLPATLLHHSIGPVECPLPPSDYPDSLPLPTPFLSSVGHCCRYQKTLIPSIRPRSMQVHPRCPIPPLRTDSMSTIATIADDKCQPSATSSMLIRAATPHPWFYQQSAHPHH